MALTKQKKEEIIKKITDVVKNAISLVFVRFDKLSVARANEMRRNLRDKGVGYLVVKKTLLKRVLDTAGINGSPPSFEGEVALAYGADMIEPAKNVAVFEKRFEQAVSPLGGILESRYLTKEEVISLARIPSRRVLLGQLVMIMQAPIQQTVQVLNEVPRLLVSVLDQVAKSKA